MNFKTKIIPVILGLTLTGCSTLSMESSDTSTPYNACQTLLQNKDWYKASLRAYRKWGIPISVQLSVIKHESSFNGDASATTSSAYGYAQALTGTFSDYKKATGNTGASRGSYWDSTDFIGWYYSESSRRLSHSPYDARTFYLAYHDGIGGYQKGTYKKKKWLVQKSKKVQKLAETYRMQLNKCGLTL